MDLFVFDFSSFGIQLTVNGGTEDVRVEFFDTGSQECFQRTGIQSDVFTGIFFTVVRTELKVTGHPAGGLLVDHSGTACHVHQGFRHPYGGKL